MLRNNTPVPKLWRLVGVGVSTFALLLTFGAQPALAKKKHLPAQMHHCGDTITQSFRLLNDLTCTNSDGLDITGSKIRIDLGGHRITGDASPGSAGLRLAGPLKVSKKVSVTNGTITDFDLGVVLGDVRQATISHLTVTGGTTGIAAFGPGTGKHKIIANTITRTAGPAISTFFIGRVQVSGNTIAAGAVGMRIEASTRVSVVKNHVASTSGDGIDVVGSASTLVESNHVEGAEGTGIDVDQRPPDPPGTPDAVPSVATKVSKNLVRASGADGIAVAHSPRTTLGANAAVGSELDGIDVSSSDGSVLDGNTASGNFVAGIHLAADAVGASLVANHANNNGANGIEAAAGSRPVIERNTTNENGFLNGIETNDNFGIAAPDGRAAKRRKNSANGNDVLNDFQQCNNSDLCTALASPESHPAALITCNSSITGDTTVANPAQCLSGNAITVTASDATIGFGNERIRGGAGFPSAALLVNGSGTSVTIKGGVFADSGIGIAVDQTTGTTISGAVAVNDSVTGMQLTRDTQTTVTKSSVLGPSGAGITIGGSGDAVQSSFAAAATNVGIGIFGTGTQDKIEHNIAIGNANGLGIRSGASTFSNHATIASNRSSANSNDGIFLIDSSDNALTANNVVGNGCSPALGSCNFTGAGEGISLAGDFVGSSTGASSSNTLTSNVVTANMGDGVGIWALGGANALDKNTITANAGDGAHAHEHSADDSFTSNAFSQNGYEGLQVEDGDLPAPLVAHNRADYNGFLNGSDGVGLGLDAPPDVDATGNSAGFNDDPNDCSPITIC